MLRPDTAVTEKGADGFVRLQGDSTDRAAAQAKQFRAIRHSGLLFVVNPGGLVGSSVVAECGYAYAHGVPICFLELPHEPVAQAMMAMTGSPAEALMAYAQGFESLPADVQLIERFLRDPLTLRTQDRFEGAQLAACAGTTGFHLTHELLASGASHQLAYWSDGSAVIDAPHAADCDECRAAVTCLHVVLDLHREIPRNLVPQTREGSA